MMKHWMLEKFHNIILLATITWASDEITYLIRKRFYLSLVKGEIESLNKYLSIKNKASKANITTAGSELNLFKLFAANQTVHIKVKMGTCILI